MRLYISIDFNEEDRALIAKEIGTGLPRATIGQMQRWAKRTLRDQVSRARAREHGERQPS